MPRLARSVRHFLEVLDEVNRLHIYDRLLANSKLTEADAVEIGRAIRRRQQVRRR